MADFAYIDGTTIIQPYLDDNTLIVNHKDSNMTLNEAIQPSKTGAMSTNDGPVVHSALHLRDPKQAFDQKIQMLGKILPYRRMDESTIEVYGVTDTIIEGDALCFFQWGRDLLMGNEKYVEIGTRTGLSALLVGQGMLSGHKRGTIYCHGSWDTTQYAEFQKNMAHNGLSEYYIPIQNQKIEAIKSLYDDLSLKLVFIDTHNANVYDLCQAIWSKIRIGGRLYCHDCMPNSGIEKGIQTFVEENDLEYNVIKPPHAWYICEIRKSKGVPSKNVQTTTPFTYQVDTIGSKKNMDSKQDLTQSVPPKPKAKELPPSPKPKVEEPPPSPKPKVEEPPPSPKPKVEEPLPSPKPKAKEPPKKLPPNISIGWTSPVFDMRKQTVRSSPKAPPKEPKAPPKEPKEPKEPKASPKPKSINKTQKGGVTIEELD